MKSEKLIRNRYLLPLSLVMIFGVLASMAMRFPDVGQTGGGVFKELIPVIKEKRAELDKSLSKKEKTRIEEMKNQLKEIHGKVTALIKEDADKEGDRPLGRIELSEEERAQLEALHWERQKIMSEAFLIADDHKAEIVTLTSDIRAKADELIKKAEDASEDDRKDRDRMDRRDGKRGRFPHHGGMLYGHHMADPAHFILFDEEMALEHLEKMQKRR